jgi:hypothetical protein
MPTITYTLTENTPKPIISEERLEEIRNTKIDEAEFTDAMLDDAIKHNRITVNRAKKPSQSKPSVQANPNSAKNTGKVILSIEVSQQLKSKEKKEYLEKIGSRLFELWEKGEVKIVL